MKRDDIIRLAREARLSNEIGAFGYPYLPELERFAALVAAAEREACEDIEDLRRDAERYRYLRNRDPKEVFNKSGNAAGVWIDWEDDLSGLQLLTGDDADAAIDAAMEDKP